MNHPIGTDVLMHLVEHKKDVTMYGSFTDFLDFCVEFFLRNYFETIKFV